MTELSNIRLARVVGHSLACWVDIVCRRPVTVVVMFSLGVAVLLSYAVNHLGINTDTANMVSSDLPWRQSFDQNQQAFPQFKQNLVIVVDGATPELADEALKRLASRLEARTDLFDEIFLGRNDPFFKRNGLLYLSLADLEALTDDLARAQPFLSRVARDPTLGGFFGVIDEAIAVDREDFGPELTAVLRSLAAAIAARNEGRFHQLSWQELIGGGDIDSDQRRRFAVLLPVLDQSRLKQAALPIDEIRNAIRELDLDKANGVRVRLTGKVAIEYEEQKSVGRSAGLAGTLALALVGVILFVALGSWRMLTAAIVTLLAGLLATAGFAALTVGQLNLISVAFAVIYIGLGIDFAVHFCLRYRELLREGLDSHAALCGSAQDVGASLVLCTVTTSLGFFAFFPTVFAGVAQLGIISGTGMYIALFSTLTLLPALLSLLQERKLRSASSAPSVIAVTLGRFVAGRGRRLIIVLFALLALLSIVLAPQARFDSNPLNLRDPGSESVSTFKDILHSSDSPLLTLSVLEDSREAANRTAEQLRRVDTVRDALSLDSFSPTDREDKLLLIDEMGLILASDLAISGSPAEHNTTTRMQALGALASSVRPLRDSDEPGLAAAASALLETVDAFQLRIRGMTPRQRSAELELLENSLLSALPQLLERLRIALEPSEFEALPASIRERWASPAGKYRVEVLPEEDITVTAAADRFIAQVRRLAPTATGFPVINLEAGNAIKRSFLQALAYALLSIVALLLFLFRRIRDTLLVLTPVLLAALLTAAATVLFDIPFNFANVIVLPLLLGIGVDNGIHLVYRARVASSADGNQLTTSSARAVLFSTFTTIFSFGSLALSQHRGMASLGGLLVIGMVLVLITSLVALPALLADRGRRP